MQFIKSRSINFFLRIPLCAAAWLMFINSSPKWGSPVLTWPLIILLALLANIELDKLTLEAEDEKSKLFGFPADKPMSPTTYTVNYVVALITGGVFLCYCQSEWEKGYRYLPVIYFMASCILLYISMICHHWGRRETNRRAAAKKQEIESELSIKQ